MKIEDRLTNYKTPLNNDSSKSSARVKENSGRAAERGGDAVNVNLSQTASQMAEDEARMEKLATVRRQLAEGSYNISGKDVAEKMLKLLQS